MRGLVVVVNYNQAPEIGAFLDDLRAFWPVEKAIIVDDGSRDGSVDLAKAAGFSVLESDQNRGIGSAIRRGIRYGLDNGYDYFVIMSSNGKMKPRELARLVAPIESGLADYVQGNRYLGANGSRGLTAFRRLAIPVFSGLASASLGRRFTDISCGFRAYTRKFCADPRMNLEQEWLDRYELEYYLHYFACRLNYRIVEVPVTIDYTNLAPGRASKIKPFVGWWSMMRPFILLGSRLKQ